METPDFYAVIEEQPDKTVGFHDGLVDLFDRMMNDAGITDQAKLQKLASLRATLDIQLKNF